MYKLVFLLLQTKILKEILQKELGQTVIDQVDPDANISCADVLFTGKYNLYKSRHNHLLCSVQLILCASFEDSQWHLPKWYSFCFTPKCCVDISAYRFEE